MTTQVASLAAQRPSEEKGCTGGKQFAAALTPVVFCIEENELKFKRKQRRNRSGTNKGRPGVPQSGRDEVKICEWETASLECKRGDVLGLGEEGRAWSHQSVSSDEFSALGDVKDLLWVPSRIVTAFEIVSQSDWTGGRTPAVLEQDRIPILNKYAFSSFLQVQKHKDIQEALEISETGVTAAAERGDHQI